PRGFRDQPRIGRPVLWDFRLPAKPGRQQEIAIVHVNVLLRRLGKQKWDRPHGGAKERAVVRSATSESPQSNTAKCQVLQRSHLASAKHRSLAAVLEQVARGIPRSRWA